MSELQDAVNLPKTTFSGRETPSRLSQFPADVFALTLDDAIQLMHYTP